MTKSTPPGQKKVLNLRTGLRSPSVGTGPRPLNISAAPKAKAAPAPVPITIHAPQPFSYDSNSRVPWVYKPVLISSGVASEASKVDTPPSSVSNIAGVGRITRSGRIYSDPYMDKTPPEKIQELLGEKATPEEQDPKGKGKVARWPSGEPVVDVPTGQYRPSYREGTEEEADEFLKFIKQSEYKIIDQLNHIPARVSLLTLLLNSEAHRNVLLKILKSAQVSKDMSTEHLAGLVGSIVADSFITFSEEEVPLGGKAHNKALHIQVKCLDHQVARVLIDNGSSLNVMPKGTLDQLPTEGFPLKPSSMIVRAFDGSRRQVIGEIELPIQVGPYVFPTNFHVMDIIPTYSCLLGRPWIHAAGAVPSSLHQRVKFAIDGKMIIVHGEEDVLVSKPASTPYVEAAEEALETAFQSLEIADSNRAEGFTPSPETDRAALMVQKFMARHGYKKGKGLGKREQGPASFLKPKGNVAKKGLGFRPGQRNTIRVPPELFPGALCVKFIGGGIRKQGQLSEEPNQKSSAAMEQVLYDWLAAMARHKAI